MIWGYHYFRKRPFGWKKTSAERMWKNVNQLIPATRDGTAFGTPTNGNLKPFSFLFGGWNGSQKNKHMFEPRGLSVLILGKNMQTLETKTYIYDIKKTRALATLWTIFLVTLQKKKTHIQTHTHTKKKKTSSGFNKEICRDTEVPTFTWDGFERRNFSIRVFAPKIHHPKIISLRYVSLIFQFPILFGTFGIPGKPLYQVTRLDPLVPNL